MCDLVVHVELGLRLDLAGPGVLRRAEQHSDPSTNLPVPKRWGCRGYRAADARLPTAAIPMTDHDVRVRCLCWKKAEHR